MSDMLESFAIDGTGRVIRPGDEVIVRPASLADHSGEAVVVGVERDSSGAYVRFHGSGHPRLVHLLLVRRADDEERTVDGSPLWAYL